MNFELGPDEELLISAVREALSRTDTLTAARSALDGAGPPVHLWKEAVRGGWTDMPGLLYGVLVLIECGRRLAPTGLLGHLTAVAVLRPHASDPAVATLLPSLLDGTHRAAYIPIATAPFTAASPASASGSSVASSPMAQPEDGHSAAGNDTVARATILLPLPERDTPGSTAPAEAGRSVVEHVPDAPGADVFIVGTPDGLFRAEDVSVTATGGYDPSRPLGTVRFARGAALPGDVEYAENVSQTLLAAEALGAAEAALHMAVEYAKQRMAFGRAIGSFQAIKHQLTDGLRLAENARSLLYYAAYAAENEPAEFGLAANAARFAADQAVDSCTRRCLSVHGGLGATWEHDAHLYFRRAQLTRLLLGGTAGAGERVVRHVIPG